MKGYFVKDGYMGYVDGKYQLFADETDYKEYMEEQEDWEQYFSIVDSEIHAKGEQSLCL